MNAVILAAVFAKKGLCLEHRRIENNTRNIISLFKIKILSLWAHLMAQKNEL